MQEGHPTAVGSDSGLSINESHPSRLQVRQQRLEMLDVQRDVVQPGTTSRQKPSDRGIWRQGLEEFEPCTTDGQEVRTGLLGNHILGRDNLQAEDIVKEGQ
jgi:hypothetical protein